MDYSREYASWRRNRRPLLVQSQWTSFWNQSIHQLEEAQDVKVFHERMDEFGKNQSCERIRQKEHQGQRTIGHQDGSNRAKLLRRSGVWSEARSSTTEVSLTTIGGCRSYIEKRDHRRLLIRCPLLPLRAPTAQTIRAVMITWRTEEPSAAREHSDSWSSCCLGSLICRRFGRVIQTAPQTLWRVIQGGTY